MHLRELMLSTPFDTITSPFKTEFVPHETFALMSETENMFVSEIKSEQDEEVSQSSRNEATRLTTCSPGRNSCPDHPKKQGKNSTHANCDDDDSPAKRTKKIPSKDRPLGPHPYNAWRSQR